MVYFFTAGQTLYQLYQAVCNILRNFSGFGEKNMTGPDLLSLQTLCDILAIYFFYAAAVLFVDFEPSAFHLQRRFDPQKICAERRNAGTAPAFPHKFQCVEHKADGHLFLQCVEVLCNICGTHATIPTFSRFDCK